jgi:acyl carrier protein
MPLSKEKIIQTIYDAIDEVNETLAEEERLEKLPDTLLAGENGNLDSLGLINFIVEVEGRIQKDFGLALNLIEALESPQKPMTSIDRLVEFIEAQANGERP